MFGHKSAAAPAVLPPRSAVSPLAPWRREAWATLTLSLPLMLTQLAQMAMTTTDIVLLGWLSPQALAAGALGFAIFFVSMVFTLGVVLGAMPMIAQARGRGVDVVRETRLSVRMGFWTALVVGLPVVGAIWLLGPLLKTSGQDPAVAELAVDYSRTLSLCLVPFLCFIVLRAFVATFNRPRSALLITMIGMVANGVFNYALIFGELGMPALGVVGAGLGTTAADLLMLVLMLLFLAIDRRFSRFHVLAQWWRADWRRLREILRVGIPIGFSLLFEVALFSGGTFMMGLIAADQLAAHQIALQVASITFMMPLGIGQATTIRVGIAAGAGNREGIRLAGWVGLALGAGCMMLSALVITALPRPIAGLFLNSGTAAEQEAVLGFAVIFLSYAGVFQIFDAIQVIGLSILRGLKDTRVPMLLTAISYWGIGLSVSAGLAFGLQWQGRGVWTGYLAALVVASILIVGRFAARERFKGLRAAIDRATQAAS